MTWQPRRPFWRPSTISIAVVLGAALAGYLATCALYPAPILPKRITVPALRGLDTTRAIAQLTALGLRGRVSGDLADPLVAPGQVSWQSPAPQTVLPQSAVVRIGVSTGRPPIAVPDVVDLPVDLARTVIAAAGLTVAQVDTVRNDTELGTVVRQQPSAGVAAGSGTRVLLSVSSGPATVKVPTLVGLTVTAARDRLAAQGLRVGALEQRFEGKVGTVLAQSPAPGDLVTKETAVNLTISGALP